MASQPTTTELSNAAGISVSYASMILTDESWGRTPPRSLAVHIYRKTGWRHESIADWSDDKIAMFEEAEPWSPRQASAA